MRIKSLAQGENILMLGIEQSTFVSKIDILTTTPIVDNVVDLIFTRFLSVPFYPATVCLSSSVCGMFCYDHDKYVKAVVWNIQIETAFSNCGFIFYHKEINVYFILLVIAYDLSVAINAELEWYLHIHHNI